MEGLHSKAGSEDRIVIILKENHLHFAGVVVIVRSIVYFYSKAYFGNKETSSKDLFFSWNLFFFVISMLVLVVASSIIFIMAGWDGLGVSSFLLITYYNNKLARASALATFSLNRMGDAFLFLLIVSLLSINTPMEPFCAQTTYQSKAVDYRVITGFFILACMTKSAQIPFSAWLPAAIAAPTPVSSLVHSSTLVTAGIYLMTKLDFFLLLNTPWPMAESLGAAILSFVAGVFAVKEKDIKKMIAMSTLRQLGILTFCLMCGRAALTLFHIATHAFFKSVLFMMSGLIILSMWGRQDLRKTTVGKSGSRLVLAVLVSSAINLRGIPFLSGFFSKDAIILDRASLGLGIGAKLVFLCACMISILYSIKISVAVAGRLNKASAAILAGSGSYWAHPALLLAFVRTAFGKRFTLSCPDKEAFKIFFIEKIIGVVLLVFAMGLTIVASCKNGTFNKTPRRNPNTIGLFLENIVNLKYVRVSAIAWGVTRTPSVLITEKTV